MEAYVRKMASVQKIENIYPIIGADKICQYQVLGWKIIDQVGKYNIGDLIIACEIDSFVPNSIAPFLTKQGHFPKVYNGVQGEKLRTIRLKKSLSQGLILPLSVCDHIESELFVGLDVSYPLGIQKWEPPPEFKSADAKGSFPSYIFKTDQERIQNCYRNVEKLFDEETWSMEEKADGSSHTAYFYNGEVGCASRNLDLKFSEENTFWSTAIAYNLPENLKKLGKNIAIQSELCGPKIQGNPYGLDEFMLFTFDIFDIDNQEYMNPEKRNEYIKILGLTSVPILSSKFSLKGKPLDDILKMADGKSVLGNTQTDREGLVFKINGNGRISFKVISNEFLLKN